MQVAEILVGLASSNIDRLFTYLVPNSLKERIKLGVRVRIPFGHQTTEGFVLKIYDTDEKFDYELKEILEVIDEIPILNDELIKLGKYMGETTISYLISAYQAMLPPALKAGGSKTAKKKYKKYLSLSPNNNFIENYISKHKQAKKQIELINYLKEKKEKIEKKELTNLFSTNIINELVKQNVLKETSVEVYRIEDEIDASLEKVVLTDEQKIAYEKIINSLNKNETFLLYGVTGSGKTEVYMQVIEKVIQNGKEAIVLVPEISLTPQMVRRFKRRFGPLVAVMHSGLSNNEKYDEWRKIRRGEVKIVVGARSAIFAPFTNLGVIIIDEEHEATYKQENNPKYHARDIALWRAKYHNITLILGSATPSLESFARAYKGVYTLLTLTKRVGNIELPTVEIVDLREEYKSGVRTNFSRRLTEELKSCIKDGKQAILLLNRRGYSTFVICSNCGFTHKCPNCDISLTYHKSSNTMRCHYCGFGDRYLTLCPSCNESALREFGTGTEKIEEELKSIFPNLRIARMDLDTTTKKGAHEKILAAFAHHEYDVLLGTQMIAKGLDFPKVTLVGVLNADTTLNLPDFRSGEKTFQLLAQVSGRAGRKDSQGKVIIQTFNKDYYAINFAKNHDYLGFFAYEMNIRKALGYPPYYYLGVLRVSSKNPKEALLVANKIASILRARLTEEKILGPSSATLFKYNNYYRYQCLIKYKDETNVRKILKDILDHYQDSKTIKVDIDLNPINI